MCACVYGHVLTFSLNTSSRFLGVMAAYSRLSNGLGAKLVTFYTDNAQRGIPSHQAIITVFDPATGTLQAVRRGDRILRGHFIFTGQQICRALESFYSRVFRSLHSWWTELLLPT